MSKVPKVNKDILELLVCPITGANLDYDEAKQELISRSAKLAFPIRYGVPIMVSGEARELTEEELSK